MSTPNPTPNPLTPSVSTGISLAVGTPAAYVLIWLWNSFLPAHAMPAEMGAALGSLISAAAGYFGKGGKAVQTASWLLPLLLLSLMLGSCAVFPAKTFDEKYAAGVTAASSALTLDDNLLQAGKLKPADAKNIEAQIDNVKAALDIAKTTYLTDQTSGGNKLASALTVLQGITTYLTQQGK